MSGFADRRRHPRIPCELAVLVDDAPDALHTTSRDLSLGGIFLYSTAPPALGRSVSLTFAAGPRSLALRGEVVHHLPEVGFGVRFDPIESPADERALGAFLESIEIPLP